MRYQQFINCFCWGEKYNKEYKTLLTFNVVPKQYLTVNEVAKILGVSSLTIRNWDQKGRLLAYRNPLNNYRLYKTEDVEKLLKDIEQSKGKSFPNRAMAIKTPDPVVPEKPKFRKLEIEVE